MCVKMFPQWPFKKKVNNKLQKSSHTRSFVCDLKLKSRGKGAGRGGGGAQLPLMMKKSPTLIEDYIIKTFRCHCNWTFSILFSLSPSFVRSYVSFFLFISFSSFYPFPFFLFAFHVSSHCTHSLSLSRSLLPSFFFHSIFTLFLSPSHFFSFILSSPLFLSLTHSLLPSFFFLSVFAKWSNFPTNLLSYGSCIGLFPTLIFFPPFSSIPSDQPLVPFYFFIFPQIFAKNVDEFHFNLSGFVGRFGLNSYSFFLKVTSFEKMLQFFTLILKHSKSLN